jgi:hypothetical protein
MTTINQSYLLRSLMVVVCLLAIHTFSYAQEMEPKTDQESDDYRMVQAAIEDYVLALYQVAPERIARSVDTSLHKIGYFDYDGETYFHVPMTYQQLYDLAGNWNKEGEQANTDSPLKIDIYEIHNKTASAKLTAVWGIDFMHLSKSSEGQWKIMNIMWQSPPK